MNHYNGISELIKFYSQHSHSFKESSEYDTLHHFIELMGEKEFNDVFEQYFVTRDNESFGESFFLFHKSMRQTDFFDNHYTKMDADDPDRDKYMKGAQYKSIGGHLDMLFWNFIHISNVTEKMFKTYLADLKEKVE